MSISDASVAGVPCEHEGNGLSRALMKVTNKVAESGRKIVSLIYLDLLDHFQS